jgi:putative transposase
MPIKRPQLVNGEIYHIVMRAIDGLQLFRNNKDYFRMMRDLFEFNDENPVCWQHRKLSENGSRNDKERKKREMIVEILAFCLMSNHIHLLIRQLKEGGISKFMRKLGAGYGNYYNKKYERQGHVFQGKFRAVRIKNDEQLITVFVYIHTNPVAILFSGWKERGIKSENLNEVTEFLEDYRWSSYSDYLNKKNFPSLTNREFLTKMMGSQEDCQRFVKRWLEFKQELADFEYVAIE